MCSVRSFILATSIFLTSGVAAQQTSVDSSYANGYYLSRLNYFTQMLDLKREIIFCGNSITEAGPWQEVVPLKNVLNRGISGDNSFGVFYRLDEVLSSKPSRIFLMIGINDLKRGTSITYIIQNFRRILTKVRAQSPHTRLYIQSVLPVAETMLAPIYKKINNQLIRQLNAEFRDEARRNNIPYVNLYDDVFADENGQMKAELTTDGLHLKPSAYILWADYLRKKNYI